MSLACRGAMLSICNSVFSDKADNRLKSTIEYQWKKIMGKNNSAAALPTPNSYSICMSAAGLYLGIVKLAPEAVDAWHAANTYVHYLDPEMIPSFYSSDPNVCSKAGSNCQGCQSKTTYETGDFNLECSRCAPGLVKDPMTGNCVKASSPSPSPSPSPDSSSPSPDGQSPDVGVVSAEECASQYINCASCSRNDDGTIKCDQCALGYVLAGDTGAGGPPPGTCVDPCALLIACAACELPPAGTDLNDPSFIPKCAECMPGFMLMVSGKYGTIGTCVEPCKTMEHCVECQPIPPQPLKEGEYFPMCETCDQGYHVVTNEEAGE